jgi:zinc/manganese transport system permease protein
MNLDLFFDPLFRVPLAAGLLLALVLPALGVLLRLRGEWLAALGLAHLAAASALAGLAVGVPAVLGGPLGAVAGALANGLGRARGNTAYAFMILIGWTTTLLIAANTPLGAAIGHALVDGQLYLAGRVQLAAAIALALAAALSLPWLTPRLVRARFLPRHEVANRLPAWRWHLGFDLLVALAMAVGTGTVGLMGAFALVFVPAWIAFRLAAGWRSALLLATGTGLAGYLLAFALALGLDQPFGPVLVAVLAGLAMAAALLPDAGGR